MKLDESIELINKKKNINEMNNLTPVNLENIYCVIAEEILNVVLKSPFIEKPLISFLVSSERVVS